MRTPDGSTRNQLRHFGWLLSLMLAVAASRLAPAPVTLGIQAAAAVLFALATVWPASLRPLSAALTFLAAPVGWVVGRVLLTLIYYGLLTPLALGMRLLGRDPLQQRFEPEAPTYWQPRRPVLDRKRYLRQF
jgi:hypothetical protein